MKFLVVGCNGMAGHIISIYLKENGNCVEGYARSSSPYIDTVIGDVNNVELLKKTVVNGNYDSVINCVGLLNQFAEKNKSQAVFVNSYIPHFLADITRDINTQIIHLSTDCVFSGKKGKYTEDDIPFFTNGEANKFDNSEEKKKFCNIVGKMQQLSIGGEYQIKAKYEYNKQNVININHYQYML